MTPASSFSEKGRWIIVKCKTKKCKNIGGYWSNSGKDQKRKYQCKLCELQERLNDAYRKDTSHTKNLSQNI